MSKTMIATLLLSLLMTLSSCSTYYGTSLTPNGVSGDIKAHDITLNFKEEYNELLRLSPPRTEYESSEEFNDRMMKVKSQSILNSYHVRDTFSIFQKIDSSSITYDADTRLIKIRHLLGYGSSPFRSYGDKSDQAGYEDKVKEETMSFAISGQGESVNGESYEATNAYGATTTVFVHDSKGYSLLMMNIQKGTYKTDFDELSLPVVPTEARSVKNNLYLKIIFTIRNPYTAYESWHSSPTFSMPFSGDHIGYYVVGKVLRVQLYSKDKMIQSYIPD